MKTRAALILAGLVLTFEAVWLWRRAQKPAQPAQRHREVEPTPADIDLNSASSEQLASLGLDPDALERLVENRPYRNKLELMSRIIVTEDIYDTIKGRITVSHADEPVKVA